MKNLKTTLKTTPLKTTTLKTTTLTTTTLTTTLMTMTTASVCLSLLACLTTISSIARAEDDLLNILSGKAGGPDAAVPASMADKAAAQAEKPSFLRTLIKSPTPEQNIFIGFFDKGDFEKALFHWPSAFDSADFAKSENGVALNAYLLFVNGIHISGLEKLLAISNPGAISADIMNLWKVAAPDSNPVWNNVVVANAANWNPKWTDAFGIGAEIRVRGRQVYEAKQIDQIKELIKKTQVGTSERAWLEWELVLALAEGNDSGIAAQALAHLMKAPNNPVSEDLMTLTAARLLYQNGYLDAAVKYDQKVSKASDYWLDAQEETGWAYIRKGEPQNTLAITKTLSTPVFASQEGPEPLFLQALANLKVCDYPQVNATLRLFQSRFRPRAQAMLSLSENPQSPAVKALIERMMKKPVQLVDLGDDAKLLPRFVTRDETLSKAVQQEKVLREEAKTAGELYARSLTGGTGQVVFQARLEDLRRDADQRVQASRAMTYGRVKNLADEEVTEITAVLQKLHIVEAEVLQQLSMVDRVTAATQGKSSDKKGTTGSQSRDRLTFPAESETWFDEIANYRVDVEKGCQAGSVKR